jgi:hypothetical protein
VYIYYNIFCKSYVPHNLEKISVYADKNILEYVWNVEDGKWEKNEKT